MLSIMRDARDRRGPTFDDIEAARTWLVDRPYCTGTANKDAYSAGFLQTACPIVGSYGAKDNSLRGAAARLDPVLTEVGVDHDVKEYRHAGHAFLNDRDAAGDRTPALFAVLGPVMGLGYEPDAAADARTRILAFFDRHLRGSGSGTR